MCKELDLIIEVDGITHLWEETVEKDTKKQHDLESAGYTVMRLRDEEVLKDMKNVKYRLENWIKEREENHL
jgi:very-short-patch-repair endonuclease